MQWQLDGDPEIQVMLKQHSGMKAHAAKAMVVKTVDMKRLLDTTNVPQASWVMKMSLSEVLPKPVPPQDASRDLNKRKRENCGLSKPTGGRAIE